MVPRSSPLGVLFDVDDTLVDFAGAARGALLDVARRFGGQSPEQTAHRVLLAWEEVSEREYNRFLAGAVGFDEMLVGRMAAVITVMDPDGALGLDAVELEAVRNESIFTHYRQYDDVAACLAGLRSAGIRIGVVSNSDGDYQRRKMAAAGLDHLVHGAVFSGDLGVAKPEPAIFLAGAGALGIPPRDVVYVGDRFRTDAVGALGAGLAAVWLNRLELPRPAAEEHLSSLPGAAGRLAELVDLHGLTADLVTALVAA